MYVLLLIVAGGMAADAPGGLSFRAQGERERERSGGAPLPEGLVLLILGCGFACRHSQRLQACGLAVWRCCRYLARKAGASEWPHRASACSH